jgi:hypothetical protein
MIKIDTFGGVKAQPTVQGRRIKAHFPLNAPCPEIRAYTPSNATQIEKNVRIKKKEYKDTPVNTVIMNKIGNHIAGVVRIVQDGPRSAKIVLFRVDPEWRHTRVTLNLINSVQKYCREHGQLKVNLKPHAAPSWMLGLMIQHGFEFMEKSNPGDARL